MNKDEILKTESENLADKTSLNRLFKFRNFYFTGYATPTSYKELAELGVKKVVDFKAPGESPQDEKGLAEEAGLEYINIPVSGCNALNKDKVREVNAAIDGHEIPTVICCMSANRTGSWFAAHLYLDHNFSVDEAIEKAQTVGMDKAGMIEGTRQLLESYQD